MWSTGALVVILATAALAQRDGRPPSGGGAGGDGDGRPRPGGGPGGDGDGPPPGECDVDRIRGLSLAQKITLKTLLAAAREGADFGILRKLGAEILEMIPPVCLRKLTEQLQPTNCDDDVIVKTICDQEGSPEVFRSLGACLKIDGKICKIAKMVALENCARGDAALGFIGEHLLSPMCLNVSRAGGKLEISDVISKLKVILLAPTHTFEQFLGHLGDTGLMDLLMKLKNVTDFWEKLPCEKKQIVIRMVADAMKKKMDMPAMPSLDLGDAGQFANIIPHFPRGLCAHLPLDQIKLHLVALGRMPFNCRPRGRPDERDESGGDDRDRSESGEDQDGPPRGIAVGEPHPDILDRLPPARRCRDQLPQECGMAIIKQLLDDSTFNLSSNLERVGNLQTCMPPRQVLGVIADATDDNRRDQICGQVDPDAVSVRERQHLARLCLNNRRPDELSRDQAQQFACLLADMQITHLRNMTADVLCDDATLQKIKECMDENEDGPPSPLPRLVAHLCGGRTLNVQAVRRLGSDAARANPGALQGLAPADLEDNKVLEALKRGLQQMARNAERGVRGREQVIAKKVKDLGDIADNMGLMSTFSQRELKDKLAGMSGNLTALLGLNRGVKPDLPEAQNRWAAHELHPDPENIDPEDLDDLGSIAEGFSSEAIEMMNSQRRLEMASKLGEHGNWKGKQAKAVTKLIRRGLKDAGQNDTGYMGQLDESFVDSMEPRTLLGFTDEEIAEATDAVCQALCRKVTEDRKGRCFQNLILRKRIAKVCLVCRGKGDASTQLDEDDVDNLGGLLQDDDEAILDRIPNDLIPKAAAKMTRMRCMRRSFRNKLRNKIRAVIGTGAGKDNSTEDIGVWALQLDQEERDNLKDTIVESIDGLVDELEPTEDEDEEDKCCQAQLPDEDNTDADQAVDGMRDAVVEAVRATTTASPSGGRRRRATTMFTCADIQAMGVAAVAVTGAEIDAMDASEFHTCLQTFGNIYDWSASQRTFLLNKVKSAIDSLCSLSSADIKLMGSIAYGLSMDDITCMGIDDDVVNNLGDMYGWTQEQLTAFVSRYLSAKGISVSALNDIDIVSLGHFVCGLTPEQISTIPASVFTASVSSLGQLKKCAVDRLQAFVVHAKSSSAYGDVSTWTASTYQELGIMLGGLSGTELKKADVGDIEGWTHVGIQHIPAKELMALSPEQLGAFSMEQAVQVSTDQRGSLTVDQQNALLTAQYGDDAVLIPMTTTPRTSGAAVAYTSLMSILMALFATLSW